MLFLKSVYDNLPSSCKDQTLSHPFQPRFCKSFLLLPWIYLQTCNRWFFSHTHFRTSIVRNISNPCLLKKHHNPFYFFIFIFIWFYFYFLLLLFLLFFYFFLFYFYFYFFILPNFQLKFYQHLHQWKYQNFLKNHWKRKIIKKKTKK